MVCLVSVTPDLCVCTALISVTPCLCVLEKAVTSALFHSDSVTLKAIAACWSPIMAGNTATLLEQRGRVGG